MSDMTVEPLNEYETAERQKVALIALDKAIQIVLSENEATLTNCDDPLTVEDFLADAARALLRRTGEEA